MSQQIDHGESPGKTKFWSWREARRFVTGALTVFGAFEVFRLSVEALFR